MSMPVVVLGRPGPFHLAFENTEVPRPWQVTGSNVQPPDPEISGPFPTVGPIGAQRQKTERHR